MCSNATEIRGKCFVNNVNLFYEKLGNSSQVLLCLPGTLGTTRASYGQQLDYLKEYFTVVSFDPRGYGKSIPPKRDFPLDFYHRDAEDAAALMEELGKILLFANCHGYIHIGYVQAKC